MPGPGHLHLLQTAWGKHRKVKCGERRAPAWFVRGRASTAGQGRGQARSAFLAVSLGHIWPTCGSYYCSQGLCAAIFSHRMGVGEGSCRRRLGTGGMVGSGGAGRVLPAGRDSRVLLRARGVAPELRPFPGDTSLPAQKVSGKAPLSRHALHSPALGHRVTRGLEAPWRQGQGRETSGMCAWLL